MAPNVSPWRLDEAHDPAPAPASTRLVFREGGIVALAVVQSPDGPGRNRPSTHGRLQPAGPQDSQRIVHHGDRVGDPGPGVAAPVRRCTRRRRRSSKCAGRRKPDPPAKACRAPGASPSGRSSAVPRPALSGGDSLGRHCGLNPVEHVRDCAGGVPEDLFAARARNADLARNIAPTAGVQRIATHQGVVPPRTHALRTEPGTH